MVYGIIIYLLLEEAAFSIMILMLIIGLVVAKFASDDLVTKYRRKLRNV